MLVLFLTGLVSIYGYIGHVAALVGPGGAGLGYGLRHEGWVLDSARHLDVVWWPRFERWSVIVPLWLPFVLVIIPSAAGWWWTRKPPPGHCGSCGYNLTGNVSGKCPECGNEIGMP
jgi:hypothetical protein